MQLHRSKSLLRFPKGFRNYAVNGHDPKSIQHFRSSIDHRLHLLHHQFRNSQISYSIGYGSGVIQQAGYGGVAQPQVDLIHIVEDPMHFHQTNSKAHPNHYSALLKLGFPNMSRVQNMGAGVYFNPYVKIKDANCNTTVVKYGVVARHVALRDLVQWNSLYIAGRLHKPVKHIYEVDGRLRAANQYNLQSVFALAILLLSKKCVHVSLGQIFEKIAAISYMGDPRMLVGGENPNKVKNIVSRQHALFEQLYEQVIALAQEKELLKRSGNVYTINLTQQSTAAILNHLPENFKRRLLSSYKTKYQKELMQDKNVRMFLNDGSIGSFDGSIGSFDDSFNAFDDSFGAFHNRSIDNDSPYLQAISSDKYLRWTLRNTVSGIIAYPALIQSLKGIFTAGIAKSAKYAWEKKLKSMK